MYLGLTIWMDHLINQMNPINYFIFLGVLFMNASCAAPAQQVPKDQSPSWLSRHKDDNQLIGVIVHVCPEVPGSEKYFSEANPYEVLYVFKDGKVHSVNSTFRGEVTDEWFSKGEMDIDPNVVVPLTTWEKRFGMNPQPNHQKDQ